jgi:hypothetical protein
VVDDTLSQKFEDGSLFTLSLPIRSWVQNPIKNGCQMTLSFNSSIGFTDIPTILRGIDGSKIYWDIKDAFL